MISGRMCVELWSQVQLASTITVIAMLLLLFWFSSIEC